MKKQLFAFIFALFMGVMINAGEAMAQNSIRVDVPFAFTANDKPLPAGTYRINSASDNRVLWKVLGEDTDLGGTFLLASMLSSGKPTDKLQLTFHRYGEVNYLVAFNTPSYGVRLPLSKSERTLRRAGSNVARKVVTVMQTMEEGSH